MSLNTEVIHAGQLWMHAIRSTSKFKALGLLVAFLLCLGGNPGFAQCVYQDADGHPYLRPSGPFTPKSAGPATLGNPLTDGTPADPSKPLKIVTLGDSAMWGDGDLPDHKIASLVGQSVANETQRMVVVDAFAHSGARLNRVDSGKEWLSPLDGENALSDLDAERPTTIEQADCANVVDHDAEIVLMDGCINEVSATDIALPILPFLNDTSPAEIEERVYRDCGTPMQGALQRVLNNFPKATIIVLNYWLIVSPDSKPIEPEYTREAALARECQLRDPKELRTKKQKWWANSECFLGTSEKCFNWAIACANGTLQGSLCKLPEATNDPTHPQDCPDVSSSSSPRGRVFLATVLDDPEFSYGTKETHLWQVPIHFLFWTWHKDEMYDIRAKLCEQFALKSDTGCKVNVTAHPNPKGASFYAFGSLNSPGPQKPPAQSSIMGILESAWSLHQPQIAQQQ
jgi:hypothetical protein